FAVVLVIFGGVDSALRSDRVRASRRILITKTFHAIAELAQRCRRRTAGQARADHNDFKFAAIVWTHETGMVLVARPLPIERPRRDSCFQIADHNCCAGLMNPSKTATGIAV